MFSSSRSRFTRLFGCNNIHSPFLHITYFYSFCNCGLLHSRSLSLALWGWLLWVHLQWICSCLGTTFLALHQESLKMVGALLPSTVASQLGLRNLQGLEYLLLAPAAFSVKECYSTLLASSSAMLQHLASAISAYPIRTCRL